MKYIVTKNAQNLEEIFIFPNHIYHDAFAEILFSLRNKTYGNWERNFPQPISAGFVSLMGTCQGRSETLNLNSRGLADTVLLTK